MSNNSPRFSIPYLAVSQAHKEITHNEALSVVDILMHASIEGIESLPPILSTGDAGKCWLVAPAATGVWSGMADAIASWNGFGWRFIQPVAGMAVWDKQNGKELRFAGGIWILPGMISSPSGGAVIDSEARSAIEGLLVHLRSIGLLGV